MMEWIRVNDEEGFQSELVKVPLSWDCFTYRGWLYQRVAGEFRRSFEIIPAERIPSLIAVRPCE